MPDLAAFAGFVIPDDVRSLSADKIVAWAKQQHGLGPGDLEALARAVAMERGLEDETTEDGLLPD